MKPSNSGGQSSPGASPLPLLQRQASTSFRNTRSPLLISLHFPLLSPPFCTTLFRCLDHHSNLIVKCWSTPFSDPKNTPKATSQQVFIILSLSLSKVITALPAQGQNPRLGTKTINSLHQPGSWSITRKAGPVSVLMMLQKQVPGECFNSWHLPRENAI